MLNLYNYIKLKLKENLKLVIFIGVLYVVFIVLGVISVKVDEEGNNVLFGVEYLLRILMVDVSPIKCFISRCLTSLFLIALTGLLLAFSFTFYLPIGIIVYRGYVLGCALRLCFVNFGLQSIVAFAFLVLLQNLIITFSIVLYICLVRCEDREDSKRFNNRLIYSGLICFGIAIIGCLIELLLAICIFRPLHFYF